MNDAGTQLAAMVADYELRMVGQIVRGMRCNGAVVEVHPDRVYVMLDLTPKAQPPPGTHARLLSTLCLATTATARVEPGELCAVLRGERDVDWRLDDEPTPEMLRKDRDERSQS